jgi:SAM-dependent methyltransferase
MVGEGSPSVQARADAVPKGRFLGGPRKDFERVGRHTFELLRKQGLVPEHNVLDVGCGALRTGYWLIHFLDPGRFCGIEPNAKFLDTGRRFILEPGLEDEKAPQFSDNDRFDFSVFGVRFDLVVARSVWTHASKAQIVRMLDAFRDNAAPGGRFLASYLPAHPIGAGPGASGRRAFWLRDYKGDAWVGASHESKKRGFVAHSTRWIDSACRERGLELQPLRGERVNRQRWARISLA